ncbi:c-type cytochrome biogenesis protein CcmI [Vespertiliibacter pulmonis]|uniref:Cytochrome c-type biogenesis protein CcmI n=1 Tax=Vespertiliibacter pulmonis TaxID=1443036 RepID=A0A3N4W9K0_9PAST|nr:c-type cytochrome biogenesis protein CcmI [Vespertiliibacter pulmonis]QLB20644.1 c-type cytochrome biogenesis protein CcmI [Vespertiliibacter pulmonis]RPE82780.1 cytochrome c-type biogenesis protein CcmI [Vespertiliibacter pulmonis]
MKFWIILAFITLIISCIAFYPLLKKNLHINNQKRDKLNKAFYFNRLQEVEREANEGIIDDPEQTKLELQQSLLEDIPTDNELSLSHKNSLGKIWFIGLLLTLGTVSTAVYLNVGSWFVGTMVENNHKKLDYFYERLKNEENEPLSSEEINQFAIALRVELQSRPQDDSAWFLLGQIGMATENFSMALESYAKATEIKPNNLLYKQKYAEMLMSSNDPKDKMAGEKIIFTIINQDPSNLGALRLLAFSQFEKGEFEMAAKTWEMMLKLLPENDSSRTVIERSIQSALSLMKAQHSSPPVQPSPLPKQP